MKGGDEKGYRSRTMGEGKWLVQTGKLFLTHGHAIKGEEMINRKSPETQELNKKRETTTTY